MLAACGPAPRDATSVDVVALGPLVDPIEYSALGDSFASGPGLAPQVQPEKPCLRSNRNAASLLARQLGADLLDVTCAGVPTAQITESVPLNNGEIPPQIEAVDANTDLITVTIGGNDLSIFGSLTSVCGRLVEQDLLTCRQQILTVYPRILPEFRARVASALRAVRAAAPQARIISIGYLNLFPEQNLCPQAGLTAADLPIANRGERLLNDAMAAAAADAGVDFISMHDLGVGHDSCGTDPWVNGNTAAPGDGTVFHPTVAGMRATAQAVVDHLRRVQPELVPADLAPTT